MRIIKTRSSGFATVELLVTIIIIGLVLSAFITTYNTIQNINKKARDIQKSNIVAFEKLQKYENTDYSSLPNSSVNGAWDEIEDFSSEIPDTVDSPRVGKAYVSTSSNTLKQIGVQVEFGSGSSKQTITYVTYIQKHGVGR